MNDKFEYCSMHKIACTFANNLMGYFLSEYWAESWSWKFEKRTFGQTGTIEEGIVSEC